MTDRSWGDWQHDAAVAAIQDGHAWGDLTQFDWRKAYDDGLTADEAVQQAIK